ncbi:MAG: TolC family protein [Verrucomicrobiota bacterium]
MRQEQVTARTIRGWLVLPAILVSLIAISGCVDVNEEVSQRPSELWRPPPAALRDTPKTNNPGTDVVDFVAGQDPYYTTAGGSYAGSPVAAVGLPKMDLPGLVDIALSNNPVTRSQWFLARARASQYGQSLSEYYPWITVSATVEREKTKNLSAVGTNWNTQYGPSLDLNWLLFNFGAREATASAAREALFSANFTYNQFYQDLVRDVLQEYYTLWAAEANLEASRTALKNAEATYDAAQKRLDSGLGNKQDALRALADVKTAETQIEKDIAAIEESRADLATVLGIEVSSQLQIEHPEEFPEFDSLDSDVSRLMAEAMQNRPNLLSSYADVRETEYNLDAARAELWPEINATLSMDYREITGSNASPVNDYVAGLTLEWDIFQGFNKWYEIDRRRDLARRAQQDARLSELQVLKQVWTAYFGYRSALRQVESASAALDAQQEAYDAIAIGYQTGINSLLDILTSQEDLDDSRRDLIEARTNLGTSIADLARATGNLPILTRGQR